MKVPNGTMKLDMKAVKIAEQIEIVAARKRRDGRGTEAQELFRLRRNIREGKISSDDAEEVFNKLQQ